MYQFIGLIAAIVIVVFGWPKWKKFVNTYTCHKCNKRFEAKGLEGFAPLDTMAGDWPAVCMGCYRVDLAERCGAIEPCG